MVKIPVYAAEREAGLEEAVSTTAAVAYICPVVPFKDEGATSCLHQYALAELFKTEAHAKNFDLYPLYSILASIGWNKNDDIFDRYETWVARNTPEDKPFNLSHKPRQIIGHITGNIAVDEDLNVIPQNTVIEELPERFHIITSAVVYKHIQTEARDETLAAEAAQLIEEIQNGEWYVSMEALFSNFDYGIKSATGEYRVVLRTKETAYLTKYLKIYNGCGEYGGEKIGRVLRNITFSGKGLVKKPANPESIIFNDTSKFNGVLASLNTSSSNNGENIMSEELKDQVKALQAELKSAQAKLEEMDDTTIQAKMEAKDAEIKKLGDLLESAKAQLNDVVKARDELKASAEATAKTHEELSAQLVAVTAELAEMKAAAKRVERVSALVDKGVDKAQAETIVVKFETLSDEQFSDIIAIQAELVNVKKTPPVDDGTVDKAGEASAEKVDVTTAEEEQEPNLSTNEEDGQKAVVSAIASFFESKLSKNRK